MLAELGLLLLLAADGRGIAVVPVGAPDEGCPSARQVTDALAARLPGLVVPPGSASAPGTLRLSVSADPGGGLRVDIADSGGAAVLRRVLPAAPRARASDCVVLADTIALIAERYWREVGYDVPVSPPPAAAAPPAPVRTPPAPPKPPPAAPPPRSATVVTEEAKTPTAPRDLIPWSLGAALAGRADPSGELDATAQLTLGTERRPRELPFGLRITGGVGTRTTVPTPSGTAGFRRFPFRIGVYMPVITGFGRIEPGLGLTTDLITVDRASPLGTPEPPRSGALCTDSACVSPGADLYLGWSFFWDQHLYVRAFARGGLAAPFKFVTETNAPLWSTSRAYLETALECGVWFP